MIGRSSTIPPSRIYRTTRNAAEKIIRALARSPLPTAIDTSLAATLPNPRFARNNHDGNAYNTSQRPYSSRPRKDKSIGSCTNLKRTVDIFAHPLARKFLNNVFFMSNLVQVCCYFLNRRLLNGVSLDHNRFFFLLNMILVVVIATRITIPIFVSFGLAGIV